jgi:hypothetical protein
MLSDHAFFLAQGIIRQNDDAGSETFDADTLARQTYNSSGASDSAFGQMQFHMHNQPPAVIFSSILGDICIMHNPLRLLYLHLFWPTSAPETSEMERRRR